MADTLMARINNGRPPPLGLIPNVRLETSRTLLRFVMNNVSQ